ncbi:MAG: amidohydrolase [Actinomycetota bacterium]
MPSQLMFGGSVYSASEPFASAMLIVDGVIAWIGDDSGASMHEASADEVIALRGALVAPAFVDAHVHATATGLLLTGLDLSGCASLAEMLDRLSRHAHGEGTILGHGWDETRWPEARPPTSVDVDAIVGDRSVYLSRVDVHSAVVSTALRRAHPDLAELPGFHPEGPLSAGAHHRVRETVLGGIAPPQRDSAQRATLQRAASLGIASLHEMAGPTISSEADLLALLDLSRQPGMPEVIGYWGELDGHDRATDLGARGAAGDLFVDGSLGSHTACLRQPYADDSATSGRSYLDRAQVAHHVAEAARRGRQSGFHVIGDGGHDIVMGGFSDAAQQVGDDAIIRSRPRLEHVEMPDDEQIAAMARLGIIASVQPGFDAEWGGPSGMYAVRLGAARAARLNPYAELAASGVTVTLGSDSPVTALDPWGSIRAAAFHRTPEQRISVRAAFTAHTRAGRRAAGDEAREPGLLTVGVPATYAIWSPASLVVQAPDERVAAWSTDPRSGTPGLPDLSPGQALPQCWLTVRHGNVIYDSGALG